MKKSTPVSKIMSGDLITAGTHDSISHVKKLMDNNCMHHVPIVRGKFLVGLVSAVDILRASFSDKFVVEDQKSVSAMLDHMLKLESIMNTEVVTIKESDSIRHAADILSTSDYNALPVINAEEELVGIVTSKDLISYLAEQY